MAPVLRDTEVAEPTTAVASASSSPAKPQPVAVEIPVTVNGARTVAGSDKREPFSENTQTVLVFNSGAVIRLMAPVGPGQLLFVTNEKSKKEVVCQVLKSKQSGSAGGYVELKFTEPAPDFWGVRLPSSVSSPANSVPAAPAVPTAKMPPIAALPPLPSSSVSKPAAPPVSTASTATPPVVTPSVAKPAAPVPQPPSAPRKVPTLSEFLAPATHTVDLSAESPRTAEPKQAAPVVGLNDFSSSANRPLPSAQSQNKPVPENATPTKPGSSPASATFDLATEEMKIPSWLEPLARNSSPAESKAVPAKPAETPKESDATTEVPAWLEPLARQTAPAATPSSPSDAVESVREDLLKPIEAPAPLAVPPEPHPQREQALLTISDDAHMPNFGSSLAIGAEEDKTASGSGKGLKIGLIAAAVILAAGAGGYWYMNQPAKSSNAASRSMAPDTATPDSLPSSTVSNTAAAPAATKPISPNPPASTVAQPLEASSVPPSVAPTTVAPITRSNSKPSRAEVPVEVPAPEPVKKPALGDVHLAAPKVKHRASSADNGAEPGLADSGGVTAGDAGALLAARGNQPVAPLPVGGDVKPARLLSSVPPVYPQLARTQRLAGDVMIDALIDINGRVSSMKVISGPAMLHQAAMDAVKQWKYQPATLNDQPTAMHLTVTVQFRLQ